MFINTDIDNYIIDLTNISCLINLCYVNKHFNRIVSGKKIFYQWKFVYNKRARTKNNAFSLACEFGFIEYMTYLGNKKSVDIHAYGEDPFRSACRSGHLECVKLLVKMGESINSKINIHLNREDAFLLACENGHLSVAKYLIELGESAYKMINIHECDDYVLRVCCQNGHLEVLQWLLQLGETNTYNMFSLCRGIYYVDTENNQLIEKCILNITHGLEIAKWLVSLHDTGKYEFIYIGYKQFEICCRKNNFEFAKWVISVCESRNVKVNIHMYDEFAFITACRHGNLEMAKWLVKLGESGYGKIDIHSCGTKAYHYSCENGHTDITKWLVELGVMDV